MFFQSNTDETSEKKNGKRNEPSTPSERSSSPDSEYRAPHQANFHRSLESLDADASSGPDTFERVQSLEELEFSRRFQPPEEMPQQVQKTLEEEIVPSTEVSENEVEEPLLDFKMKTTDMRVNFVLDFLGYSCFCFRVEYFRVD